MKKIAKFLAASLSALMILGAVAVSADDTAISTDYEGSAEDILIMPSPTETEPETVTVYLTHDGVEELCCISSGVYAADGSVTAGDVIAELLSDHEVVGLDAGYVSSIDNVEAGSFGGWDGWLYAVEYYDTDENGETVLYSDIPVVGVNDYPITTDCNIILYYADYGVPFAKALVEDNGMLKLAAFSPVYDENYNVVAFEEAPLANGEFVFTAFTTDENGDIVIGKKYIFTADENGMTKLHTDLRELPNGEYLGFVGKQSTKTAVINGETVTLPEVVRSSDFYVVDVHPTPEEIMRQKVFLLMLGM